MYILNTNETKSCRIYIATILPTSTTEATAASAESSSRAGQRRLRAEAVGVPNHVITNRPTNDLQAVYEKFNKKPRGDYSNSPEEYFANIGDIESMKILIKYGLNVAKSNIITAAAHKSQHAMVKYLADNGAVLQVDVWADIAFKTWIFHDISEEKLATLEYLLDRGTGVNLILQGGISLLKTAMLMQPADAVHQSYKDRIIKMLLARGAKLNP